MPEGNDSVTEARDAAAAHLSATALHTLDQAVLDGAPENVRATFETAGKALGDPAAAMAVFDWGAEALRTQAKIEPCNALFRLARKKQARLRLGVGDAADCARFARFAAAVKLDHDSLVEQIERLTTATAPDVASAGLELVASWLRAAAEHDSGSDSEGRDLEDAGVGRLDAWLLDAVEHLGRTHARSGLVGELLERSLVDLRRSDNAAWRMHGHVLGDLVQRSSTLRDVAADVFPSFDSQIAWRAILLESGVIEWVAAREPAHCARWLCRLIGWLSHQDADAETWLERVVAIVAPTLSRLDAPFVLEERDDRMAIEPGVVDILLQHAIAFEVRSPTFNLYYWSKREPRRPLTYLAGSPLAERLVASYYSYRDNAVTRDAMLTTPALSVVFDRIIATLEGRLQGATLARLDQEVPEMNKLISTPLLEQRADLRALLARIDVAGMLARTLRAGILDELAWPAQDALNDSFSTDANRFDTDGPFPYLVTNHQADALIVALGPEGEVYRAKRPEGVPASPRAMRFAAGDVLYFALVSSLRVARWISEPARVFEAGLYTRMTLGCVTPEGNVWDGSHILRKLEGDFTHLDWARYAFASQGRFWRNDEEINPDAGRALGAGRPDWLCGDDVVLEACTYWPVPSFAASPLRGIREGQWGIRVRALAGGRYQLDTLDDHHWTGSLEGAVPLALLRLPLRDHDVVYASKERNNSLWLADGSHPLIPANTFERYWAGIPQVLPLAWWHYLVPRDLAGSAALMAATVEQARALLDAAWQIHALGKDEDQAKSHAAEGDAVVREVLADITHPRLRRGIWKIAQRARELEGSIRTWQAVGANGVQNASSGIADDVTLDDADVTALARLFRWDHSSPGVMPLYFEQSIRRSDYFLAVPGVPQSGYTATPSVGSIFFWHLLLQSIGSVVRAALSPGIDARSRSDLRAVLELWADTGFSAEPSQFRELELTVTPVPQGDVLLVQGESRYVLRAAWVRADPIFLAIERRGERGFVDPAWATVRATSMPRGPDRHGIRSALAALDAHGTLPWSAEIGAQLSAATGLLPATAALLWNHAIRNRDEDAEDDDYDEDSDAELREELGISIVESELASWEVADVDLVELYARSLPPNPAALYAPLADDGSGLSPVQRLAAAWNELAPTRALLDGTVLSRLRETLHLDAKTVLQHARDWTDPDHCPSFTRDATWVMRPWDGFQNNVAYMRGVVPPGWPKHADQSTDDERRPAGSAFSGWVLRQFLQYVPWAHQELPFGHPMHAHLARMCALIGERLANPQLLLLAGAIDLSEYENPRELAAAFAEVKGRFTGAPYVAPDGGDSAPGLDRGDLVVTWPSDLENSFFLAFRPERVAEPAAFDRLAQDLGIYDVFRRTDGGCTCGLQLGSRPVVDITDLPSWVVWRSAGFQRIVQALAVGGEHGLYPADPRVSCPALVAEVRAAHQLSEAAATLWLQIATIAEPTRAWVQRINAWTEADFDAPRAELLARGLVVDGDYDTSARCTFVPGSVVFPEPPAAPLEASKLPLYGLEPDAGGRLRAPFGVVLPLRPLPALFAEAWRQSR